MCTIIDLSARRGAAILRFPRRGVYAERETPVPGAEVRLSDGTTGQYVCQTIDGQMLVVAEGRTLVVDPLGIMSDDQPGTA